MFSGNLGNLRELYIHQLQYLLSAEAQLTEALPKMIDAATAPGLQQIFTSHLQETRQHVSRLQDILGKTEKSVEAKKSEAMSSLISEGEEMMRGAKDDSVRDAALILMVQQIEHYEMASYGAVRHFAGILGEEQAVATFDTTLKEESHANQQLAEILMPANPDADRAAHVTA